jgi:fructokinase
MENKNYVVGIGEALLDRFTDKKKKHKTRKLGGAPTIFAYHAAKSGWTGMVISAINDQSDGKEIKKKIEKGHKLQSRLTTINDKPSAIVEVKYKDGNRNNPEYIIDKDSAWSEIPYTDDLTEIAHQTKAVYFGTLASYCGKTSKDTIGRFLDEVAKDKNSLLIYDVNLRTNPAPNKEDLFDKDLVLEYVGRCNVLKVNLDELRYLCKLFKIKSRESERKKCLKLMNECKNIKYLIVTMGEDGSSIFWRDEKHNNKYAMSSLTMPLNVENNVGAGDALAGAFIGEILRNKTPDYAHRIAVQRSAIVCEEGDSMPKKMGCNDLYYYAFVSYAREDEFIVDNYFCKCFEEKKIPYWIDQKRIRFGKNFSEEIENAIRDCETFVYFYSKNAKKSEWVHKEVEIARKYDKHIIPILLDNEPYDKDNELYDEFVEKLLKNIHHFDYSLSKLVTSIEERLNPQP